MPEFTVTRVSADATFPLRRRILGPRPDEPRLQDMARTDDEDADSGHFAVFLGDCIVGTGTVRRRPAPWSPQEVGFQIRGMAVDELHRHQGIGSAVLMAIMEHVEARGRGLLWCQARMEAHTLYGRAGFLTHGVPFLSEASGEQVTMYRRLL